MAGRAAGTGSGTFVFTCATTAREPAVAASATATAATRRSNIITSAMFEFPYCSRRVYETETRMKRACLLAVALTLGATFPHAAAPTITIDASTPAGKVSPLLYGLMTEEINHSYDGGLYAELIRNRAFIDDAASPAHWSAIHGDGAAAAIALDPGQAVSAAVATSLRVEVTQAADGHRAGI